MGATVKRMRRGLLVALSALLSNVAVFSASAEDVGPELHRLYDRQTDCALFDTAGFSADRASWDGPCTHGLASGRGTATYFARGGASQSISADFLDGLVLDGKAEIAWNDGARYVGLVRGGKPNGAGVLVDAKGNRFDGEWKDGALNGHGAVLWVNGDRYEGDWVAGKADGHGLQTWADGQKYDGQWQQDLPNGQGTLTRRDGTSVSGMFIDGKRQVAAASTPQPAPTVAAGSAGLELLNGLTGRTLVSVDGATVTFALRDGAVLRTTTATDGTVLKAAFVFLGNGLGTVTDGGDPPQVSGVFRTTPDGIEAEYSDGHLETLALLADGLAITTKDATGTPDCAAWYPQGHAFSADERKAAVASYARRLGLSDAAPAIAHPSCIVQAATSPTDHRPAPAPITPRHKPGRIGVLSAPPVTAGDLQTVPIKVSTVHPIDTASPADTIDRAVSGMANADETVASNCLRVDSDGSYWGFRNHCGYPVQFAYCLLHGTNRMTACGADGVVSVPGSVSGNGFSALFGDDSLGERDVEHNFRWVGCKGGAGEVSAHLDAIEPASGKCERAGRTLAGN